MSKTKKNAFTLLEILVVISIIGILIALGTAAFSTTQKKSRDARRKADIKAMQNGLEQFHAKYGDYPESAIEGVYEETIFPAGLPEDPKNTGENTYTFNLSEDSFCVCALLESSSGNASALPAGSVTICSYGTGDYYCLSNLQ